MLCCRQASNSAVTLTALLCVLFFALAGSAIAEDSVPQAPAKPVLIVRATTPLEDEGRPTLDLVDLERYFVNQLADHGVVNVVPLATAKIPNPPAPNVYLIEVSVDTMRLGKRSTWNDPMHRYDDHDIFEVDLTLALEHFLSGRVVGTTGERHEHWFTSDSEWQQLIEKRAAIFKAADNLAGRFVDEWAAGKFGEDLPRGLVQSDLEKLIEQALLATGLSVPALAVAFALLILSGFVIPSGLSRLARKSSRVRQALQQELDYAIRLALKTDNFSESACCAAAAGRRDQLLADHAKIEEREAHRLLQAKHFEDFYKEVAKRAAKHAALEKAQVVEILRKTHEWEYRVLQKAKRQAVENSQ